MRKLFHNCKGAVTVMVTLLLIPAILISGTGVDLARVYTAKSIVQDANQLAANSVLASYEALLQDLYGLFGVMSGGVDPAPYVKQAIEGGDWDKGLGTFQVFYGSNLNPAVLTPAPNQTLGNVPVFRRQIEEYSKLRAPAIIAELLMEKLDVFEKIQEDAKVIQKKMEVDEGVEQLEMIYRKIYDFVEQLDPVGPREGEMTADYSATAERIQDILWEMEDLKEEYRETVEAYEEAEEIYETTEDEDERAAAAETMEEMEELGLEIQLDYQDAWGRAQEASKALWSRFRTYQKELEDARFILEDPNPLTGFTSYCSWAERTKESLRQKIEELREALDSGKCSDTLRKGLTAPEDGSPDGPSILDRYEALLKYDVEAMGTALRDHNSKQLKETVLILEHAELGPFELLSLRNMNCDSYFPLDPESTDSFQEVADASTEYHPYGWGTDANYKRFEEIRPPESQEFWNELKTLYDAEKGRGAEKENLEGAVGSVFKKAQSIFKGLLNFEPAGAKRLSGGEDDSAPETGSQFGTEGSWDSMSAGKSEMKRSLNSDFLGKLAAVASDVGNKLLLLTYDTEMFSDFSCPKEGQNGYPKENMAGIPLSTEVNYYFQSELEYLYNGNLADARANLVSVAGMMFLVRFVLDYVASFSVAEVNGVVNGVKAALAWTGPFAILAGELARLALSIGEAAIDVSRLRQGNEVAVFKTGGAHGTWRLSIGGLVGASTDGLSQGAVDSAFDGASAGGGAYGTDSDEGLTLNYTDYMRFFLLLVPGDTLAGRTQKLIELNVTNYQGKLKADEEKMASAERYDLDKLFTGFTLTTTVDMRMLFLSMPFAQEGVKGVIPPRTLAVSATEYRGY